MTARPGRALLHACAALACALVFCTGMAGCASHGPLQGMAEIGSAQDAGKVIAIGKSTKADVLAAFGKTTFIEFDSGYEVWVYRIRASPLAARGTNEFVVLFAPSGVVAKTRTRIAAPG